MISTLEFARSAMDLTLDDQIESLENEVFSLQGEILDVESNIETLEDEIDEYYEKIRDIRERLWHETDSAIRNRLNTQIFSFEEALEEARENLSIEEDEYDDLETPVELTQSVDELNKLINYRNLGWTVNPELLTLDEYFYYKDKIDNMEEYSEQWWNRKRALG